MRAAVTCKSGQSPAPLRFQIFKVCLDSSRRRVTLAEDPRISRYRGSWKRCAFHSGAKFRARASVRTKQGGKEREWRWMTDDNGGTRRKNTEVGNSIDDNRKESGPRSWKPWTILGVDRQGKETRGSSVTWDRAGRDRSTWTIDACALPETSFCCRVQATSKFISFNFRFVGPRRAVRRPSRVRPWRVCVASARRCVRARV